MPTSKVQITVHPDQILQRVSPYLTGACLEDVNHEVYGGIYSQMIFGESFEEEPMEIDARLNPAFAGLSGTISCRAERWVLTGESEVRSWQPFRTGTASGRFVASRHHARRGCRSQQIEFLDGEGELGIENQGLNRWGMALVAGREYEGTIVLSSVADTTVTLALESRDGAREYARTTVQVAASEFWNPLWSTHEFTLTPESDDAAARFVIKLTQPGRVWVDYVLLQPAAWGRFHNLAVRRDIAEALVDQGLTVLRYGGYMVNTDWEQEARCPGSGYRWKKMIGPRQDRPPYLGTFYPFNSNGFGIIDYVALCHAAGFACVPTINPSETPQDVADLLEYLNGDAGTPWGARRAADGFPEPFGVRYLQIGNEEFAFTADQQRMVRRDYPALFRAIAEAVWAKDPQITLILAPWLYSDAELEIPENRALVAHLLETTYAHQVLWDVHVGGDGPRDADGMEQFLQHLRAYLDDIAPENSVRFCILEENGWHHDLRRALGHAHNILTLERLGLVDIDCAANCLQPWQQHDNGWDQGQLFFTPTQVWGMPPYYAQQMLARHYQPLCVQAAVTGDDGALDITATRSEDGNTLLVKVVNLSETPMTAEIDLGGFIPKNATAKTEVLTGALDAENSPEEPERVAPVTADWTHEFAGGKVQYTFDGYSFTVISFA